MAGLGICPALVPAPAKFGVGLLSGWLGGIGKCPID